MSENLNDLLELAAEGGPISEQESLLAEVKRFVAAKGIKSGSTKIPVYIVYEAYQDWIQTRPLSDYLFARHFNTLFQVKRLSNTRCYDLDPTAFNLPVDYSVYRDAKIKRLRPKKEKKASMYHGVFKNKDRWVAILKYKGMRKDFGTYSTQEGAAKAYDRGVVKHLGPNFGPLNFPQNLQEYINGKKS